MTESHPNIKIRRIPPHKRTYLGKEISSIKTALHFFYKKHLKSIPLIRAFVVWIVKKIFHLNSLWISLFDLLKKKYWYSLITLADYVKIKNIAEIKLLDAEKIATPTPRVFPAEDQSYLKSPHESYTFPPIYIATITRALVYGGTNLVMVENTALCHDLYNFDQDATSEELHRRHFIDVKNKRLLLLRHDFDPEQISVAASFVDACASNYAHWLTEVLPRIAIFCAEDQFKNIPIIINDALHPNIMESLFLVVGQDREIILLPIGRAIQVESLYVTSVTGYVPFERRNYDLADHFHGLFSPHALDLIRNYFYKLVNDLPEKTWPEKCYLRRSSHSRSLKKADFLEKLLLDYGYTIIEPEKLSFLEQIQLFSNVKKIIAPTGAALSNAIFCRKHANVAVLMGKHRDMIYRYWLNMLSPLGINVSYILGNDINNENFEIHSDYSVSEKDIMSLMKLWEDEKMKKEDEK